METFFLAFLGPYAKLVLAVSLVLVVVLRKAVRKRHILALLLATVLAFVGFLALLLWGVVRYDGTQPVAPLHFLLGLLAAIAVGCGASIGYCFILKSLGLVSLEGTEPSDLHRR